MIASNERWASARGAIFTRICCAANWFRRSGRFTRGNNIFRTRLRTGSKTILDSSRCFAASHNGHFERKITHYRAPAHKCNACHCKKQCTDFQNGRLLEHRPDSWLQSGLSRFHGAISLASMPLAVIVLVVELLRYRQWNDWVALLILLLPITFAGSRHLVSFREGQKSRPADL